jgi:hypothetical protein
MYTPIIRDGSIPVRDITLTGHLLPSNWTGEISEEKTWKGLVKTPPWSASLVMSTDWTGELVMPTWTATLEE